MLIDNAPVMIFLVNEKAEITYANQEACSILGYSFEELLAKTVFDLNPDYPADRWHDGWKSVTRNSVIPVYQR